LFLDTQDAQQLDFETNPPYIIRIEKMITLMFALILSSTKHSSEQNNHHIAMDGNPTLIIDYSYFIYIN
jgi:hypothetical protein